MNWCLILALLDCRTNGYRCLFAWAVLSTDGQFHKADKCSFSFRFLVLNTSRCLLLSAVELSFLLFIDGHSFHLTYCLVCQLMEFSIFFLLFFFFLISKHIENGDQGKVSLIDRSFFQWWLRECPSLFTVRRTVCWPGRGCIATHTLYWYIFPFNLIS